MKRTQKICSYALFVCILTAAATVFYPRIASAISEPGLHFSVDYQPALVPLAPEYEQSYPALFQAERVLLDYPTKLAEMDSTLENKLGEIRNNTNLDGVTMRDNVEEAKRKYETELKEINKVQTELRNAFFTLALDLLRSDSEPGLLLSVAQQYFSVRSQAPEMMQKEISTAKTQQAPAEDTETEKSNKEDSEADTANAEDAVEPMSAVIPTRLSTQTPSRIIGRTFKKTQDVIIVLCEEIRERFPHFEYMDRVIRLMAITKMELGMTEDALYLWKELLAKHPDSQFVGDTLFRMAEYEFVTPTSFDHFTTAADLYKNALKYYKEASRDRFRIIYKMAWAQYLSPDLNEEAKPTFVALYKEIKKADKITAEMQSIQAEVLEVVKQIMAKQKSSSSGSMFGR